MFNLETSISEWRQQMLTAGIQTPVPLDELECHLREEIEQRMQAGLGGAEAFQSAVQKFGAAPGMQSEFAKIVEPGSTREQMVLDAGLVAAALLIPVGVAGSVWHHRAEMTTGQLLASLLAIATFAGLIGAGRLGCRRFPLIGSKRTRDVIGCVAVGVVALWWGIFLRVIAPRFDFTMMGFVAAFLWAFFAPAGVWLGMVFGFERASRKAAKPNAEG